MKEKVTREENTICEVLDCEAGDILEYQKEE